MAYLEPAVNGELPQFALTEEALAGMIDRIVCESAERICAAHEQPGGLVVSRAWVYQRPEQVEKLGADAPWYVGWIDPDKKRHGKSCGVGPDGKRNANQLRRRIEAELVTGTYGTRTNATWSEFRAEYETKVLPGLAPGTREMVRVTLGHFERLVKPGRLASVTAAAIDQYRALRRQDRGRVPGTTVAPTTLNKELGYLRAALRKARRWGYMQEVPAVDMERTVKRIKGHMTPAEFAAVYHACEQMDKPAWWRALLVTIFLTGWRVGAVMQLRRADVDLQDGSVLVRGESTKGRRDQAVPLHPVVLAHLKALPGFTEAMFPFRGSLRTLRRDFYRLQELAGLTRRHGFHSLKRAFCTLNAPRLDPTALQYLAQHQSFETTRAYYIDQESQAQEAVSKIYVPDVLKTGTDG